MNDKKIAIIGCGIEGYSASTYAAISEAEKRGMEIIHCTEDDINAGLDADVIIKDELPRGINIQRQDDMLMEIKNPYVGGFDFCRPETRAERRAKRPKRRKRKF